MQPKTVNLPPQYVFPDRHRPETYKASDINRANTLPGVMRDPAIFIIATRTQREIHKAYTDQAAILAGIISDQIMAASAVTTGSELDIALGRLDAINHLIEQKKLALAGTTKTVLAYFKQGPFAKTIEQHAADFVNRSRRALNNTTYKDFVSALNAAYDAKTLTNSILLLQQAAQTTQARISTLRAQQVAAQTAARVLAERKATEAAHTQLTNDYAASASVAVAGTVIVTAANSVVSAVTSLSLRTAIGAAIGALETFAAGVAAGFAVGVTAFLYAPRLGNGELAHRIMLQMPLSEMAPGIDARLVTAPETATEVELPFRLSARINETDNSEIVVAKTDGQLVPSQVRVIAATYDTQRNTYSATTADVPPRTLTWTPIVTPDNASTTLPVEQIVPPAYEGATLTPAEARIDSYPDLGGVSWDDYVIVFPANSGLPPLYVMFRDRRETPGHASGSGVQDSPIWLNDASEGKGAPIPTRIADQLRDRAFRNWRTFRKAFWQAVSEDTILASQFKSSNLSRLKKGYSPRVQVTQSVGGRVVFELHHEVSLVMGGKLYDLDNIRVATPKLHIEIHRKSK